MNGKSVPIPAPWVIAPASHGSAAPPTADPAFITPMAADASRGCVSSGATAMVVGKTGPRKKPSTTSAAPAAIPEGASQASMVAAAIPARQQYIRPDVVAPSRAATGLIRNRPAVSPSQNPLTAYP